MWRRIDIAIVKEGVMKLIFVGVEVELTKKKRRHQWRYTIQVYAQTLNQYMRNNDDAIQGNWE